MATKKSAKAAAVAKPGKKARQAKRSKAPVGSKETPEPKPALKPVELAAGAPAKPAKKRKLVRDSFTIPKDEYEQLAALKSRALSLDHPSKKSEILRAGIAALGKMTDGALAEALDAVPRIKTGRPKNSKGKAKAKA